MALKDLVAHILIHASLEMSAIALLDQIVTNTFLSAIIGIIVVEGIQAFWRKRRTKVPVSFRSSLESRMHNRVRPRKWRETSFHYPPYGVNRNEQTKSSLERDPRIL